MKIHNYSKLVNISELNTFFKRFKYLDTNIRLFIMPKNKYLSIFLEYVLIFIYFYNRTPSIFNHNSYRGYTSYVYDGMKKRATYVILYTYHLDSVVNDINKISLLDTLIHELRHTIQFKKNMFKSHTRIHKSTSTPSKAYKSQIDELDAEMFSKRFISQNKKIINHIFNIKYKFNLVFNKKLSHNQLFIKNN